MAKKASLIQYPFDGFFFARLYWLKAMSATFIF